MFENVVIHTHIRTPEAYLYYKLTSEHKDSGELKSIVYVFPIQKHMGPNLTLP